MSVSVSERLSNALKVFDQVKVVEDTRKPLSPDEVRFQSLLIAMRNKTVSYRQAVIIVGGDVRLKKLMESGVVRCNKPSGTSNKKWRINAADCYNNVRPRLKEVYANI